MFLVLVVVFLQLSIASATEVEVASSSQNAIVLNIEGGENEKVIVTGITGIAETATVRDTYALHADVKEDGEEVSIVIDVRPIYEDYAVKELESVLVTGTLQIGEEQMLFAKRVTIRESEETTARFAPELSTSFSWIAGVVLLLVILILSVLRRKPVKKRRAAKKKKRRKARK